VVLIEDRTRELGLDIPRLRTRGALLHVDFCRAGMSAQMRVSGKRVVVVTNSIPHGWHQNEPRSR